LNGMAIKSPANRFAVDMAMSVVTIPNLPFIVVAPQKVVRCVHMVTRQCGLCQDTEIR
jgi:hypothetical protein